MIPWYNAPKLPSPVPQSRPMYGSGSIRSTNPDPAYQQRMHQLNQSIYNRQNPSVNRTLGPTMGGQMNPAKAQQLSQQNAPQRASILQQIAEQRRNTLPANLQPAFIQAQRARQGLGQNGQVYGRAMAPSNVTARYNALNPNLQSGWNNLLQNDPNTAALYNNSFSNFAMANPNYQPGGTLNPKYSAADMNNIMNYYNTQTGPGFKGNLNNFTVDDDFRANVLARQWAPPRY